LGITFGVKNIYWRCLYNIIYQPIRQLILELSFIFFKFLRCHRYLTFEGIISENVEAAGWIGVKMAFFFLLEFAIAVSTAPFGGRGK
jgi:hypothetical protein